MRKILRLLLIPIFALTIVCSTYAYSPDDNRDSVVIFKFITKKDTFWATYKDNEQQFDRLANFIHLHREKIMRRQMPVYVNGYCSALPTPEDNKNIGRIRSNHVKSYIIMNYGFREEMFKTKNHIGNYQGLSDVVTVAFVILRPDTEKPTTQKTPAVEVIPQTQPQPEPIVTPEPEPVVTTTTEPIVTPEPEVQPEPEIELAPEIITQTPQTVEKPSTVKTPTVQPTKNETAKTERKHKIKKPKTSSTVVVPITSITSIPTEKPTVAKTPTAKNKPKKVKAEKIKTEKVKAEKIKTEKVKPTKEPKAKKEKAKTIVITPIKTTSTDLTTAETAKSKPVKVKTEKVQTERVKPVKIDTYFFQNKFFNAELKTNILALAATAPNLEAEFIFSNRISLNLEGQWAHTDWKNDSRHFRLWNFSPEIRVYPFKKTAVFFGAYYNIGEYNFKFNETGYQGKHQGFGLSVGYKLPVTRSVGFEFSLGAGYINTHVSNYFNEDGCNRFISKYPAQYITPTKAKISFIWRIGGAK